MMVRALLASLLLLLGQAGGTNAQTLVTGLSFEKVEISSDFTGTEIAVFGTINNLGRNADGSERTIEDYEVVIVVEGPKEPAVIRKKARTFGIWINREGQEFGSVPGSYLLMATKGINEPAFKQALKDYNIGFANVPLGETSADANVQEFRDAVIRLKQAKDLYLEADGVTLLGDSLFRARFKLPAVVPVGIHQVRSYLFHENNLISGATHAIRISKTGFEQLLYKFAHQYGFVYGVICVLLAMLVGWLGSVIFRRD